MLYNRLMNSCNCKPGVVVSPEYNTASSCETTPTQLRTVTIPAEKGGDAPSDLFAPRLGSWQNTIVVYAKNKAVYIYDVNGVYTNLTGTDWGTQIADLVAQLDALQEQLDANAATVNGQLTSLNTITSTLQADVAAANSSLTDETTARKAADTSLAQQITSLQTQLNQVAQEATGQSTAITALQTTMSTLQSQVDSNTTSIEELEAAGSVSVVQTTGDSTTAVMSQKAVTDIVGVINTTLAGLDDGDGV